MGAQGVDQVGPAGSGTAPLPGTLLGCLPVLWSRLLFPGVSARPGRFPWKALLFFLVLPAALIYPCLSFRLFEPDEGRYAEIAREMLVRGEWVVPYLQAQPYLDKPPLLYWLVIGSYRVFGVHDWAARLVPALAVHGCVLLTFLLGRRSLGDRAGFWGALALSLAPGFLSMGRLLLLDSLLAFWVTGSLLAGFEAVRGDRLRWGWWLAAAAACGLGILTKGPVALLLLLPPLVAYRWLTKSGCRVGGRGWLAFAAMVLGVSLPWYVAVCRQLPQFARYFLWEHNVLRFLAPFDHLRPIWFYGPVLFVGLLPASLLVVPLVRFLLTGDPHITRQRGRELGFMVLAGGWCVLFFSLSGCKLPTYVLPGFPALALVLGSYIAASRWRGSVLTKTAAALTVVAMAVGHYWALPGYALYHSPMSRWAEVVRYCGDASTPVVCYPRNCDSVSFYLGRDDFRSYRSKETPALVRFLHEQRRTAILFTHRHSLESLREVLPPALHLTGVTPLSGSWKKGVRPEMCYMAIVERREQRP